MAPGTFNEHLLCWLGAHEEGLSQEDSDRIRSGAQEFAASFSALAPIERGRAAPDDLAPLHLTDRGMYARSSALVQRGRL